MAHRDLIRGTHWLRLRAYVLAQSQTCWVCGGLATEVDHVLPRASGGTNALENLRPCCRTCNRSRGGTLAAQRMLKTSRDW